MKNLSFLLSTLIILLIFNACQVDNKILIAEAIADVRIEFAPDKRVALFDITTEKIKDTLVLHGESNLPQAIKRLKEKLNTENISFIDSIQMLPTKEIEGNTNGIINNSVANLRSKPKHSAELATQATLGTPVKIYKKEGDWLLIQTPDKYLSWVDAGGISVLSDDEFASWKKKQKMIFTKTYGHSFSRPDSYEIVSDLVAGSILEIVERTDLYYVVRYPDGRRAYVSRLEAEAYDTWLENMNTNKENLVLTSKELMGVPYLWGGTSTKGMDCSGFTKTIYFLNGMIIPRDASQQVHTGMQTDENGNFENLEKGDLLFFGRKATDSTKEKVVHVGMWIGNNEFIHASNQVRVSSVNPNAVNFDAYNRNRYLRSKRILKAEDKDLIRLKQVPLF